MPAVPEDARVVGRGLPRGDSLFVPWTADGRVLVGGFGHDGRLVAGPWEAATAEPGPGATQVGVGPVGEDLAVVYLDAGGTRVAMARVRICPRSGP